MTKVSKNLTSAQGDVFILLSLLKGYTERETVRHREIESVERKRKRKEKEKE